MGDGRLFALVLFRVPSSASSNFLVVVPLALRGLVALAERGPRGVYWRCGCPFDVGVHSFCLLEQQLWLLPGIQCPILPGCWSR